MHATFRPKTEPPSFLKRSIVSKGTRFFMPPESAGRRITAGFSFIQRIGKSANIDVWFPESLRAILNAKLSAGFKLSDQDFPAEWAAVRQFELLQESANYKIYDLKSDDILRSMVDLSTSMRGGGYRVTIATLGSYVDPNEGDDLEILDQHLQERLAALAHMMYLESESERETSKARAKLASGAWDYRTELPHVGVTLGARDIFRPMKEGATLTDAAQRHKLARQFFDIVERLPQNHILHDTAVGLQLPTANAENEATYIADGEDTLHGFSQAMSDVFSMFDRFSSGEAGWGVKSTVTHMRGYGDHMMESGRRFQSELARCAM